MTCPAIFTFSRNEADHGRIVPVTFVEHYLLCALSVLFGWTVGRIASRASRIPGFTTD